VEDYGLQVTFTYDSKYGENKPEYRKKIRKIVSELRWAHDILDKSDPGWAEKLAGINPDVVFVCTPDSTHLEIVKYWMSRTRKPLLFIEKPLESDLNRARDIQGYCKYQDDRVFVFDHYRTRWTPNEAEMGLFRDTFGISLADPSVLKKSWLKSFDFYFVEDHSSNDKDYLKSNPDAKKNKSLHGPLELENRTVSANGGMILDMMPHAFAFLDRFAILGTVTITHVKAGKYVGVSGDLSKSAGIDNETFAMVKIRFKDLFHNQDAEGTIYVGKGIGGVRQLRRHKNKDGAIIFDDLFRDVKYAVIRGTNGAEARFDFKSEKKYSLVQTDGKEWNRDLDDPHDVFFRSVIEGSFNSDKLMHGRQLGFRGNLNFLIPVPARPAITALPNEPHPMTAAFFFSSREWSVNSRILESRFTSSKPSGTI
jgi:predicted dehydrogenase